MIETLYDVIIIGSGPAGLAAAIYARRAGLGSLVLEKEYVSGGQVLNTYEVDNYPGMSGIGGFDLGMKLKEHADQLGATFITGEVKGLRRESSIITVETAKATYRAKAVIIAAGAGHRKLGIPGEKEFAGRGVSYCATCDGAFFRGKTTAVVGGGDVAVEDAIFLARMCEKVYVVHRRHELRAAGSLQEKLFALPNVEMIWDSQAVRIEGEEMVQRLIVKGVHTGEERTLPVDGVFAAIGITPSSAPYEGLVDLDDQGYIVADETGRTNRPGVFAAGDIRTKAFRQIITAAADGANAVHSVEAYLNELGK